MTILFGKKNKMEKYVRELIKKYNLNIKYDEKDVNPDDKFYDEIIIKYDKSEEENIIKINKQIHNKKYEKRHNYKENWECDAHIDFEYKNFYIWY